MKLISKIWGRYSEKCRTAIHYLAVLCVTELGVRAGEERAICPFWAFLCPQSLCDLEEKPWKMCNPHKNGPLSVRSLLTGISIWEHPCRTRKEYTWGALEKASEKMLWNISPSPPLHYALLSNPQKSQGRINEEQHLWHAQHRAWHTIDI